MSDKIRCRQKCKPPGPGTFEAYCGDTCNCGWKEEKRALAIAAIRQQVKAVRKRWGESAITEAIS